MDQIPIVSTEIDSRCPKAFLALDWNTALQTKAIDPTTKAMAVMCAINKPQCA